ncbi:PTS ascorbate transporter subunit IIC [Anaerobacillus arseniciselenatis]|uniref:PTS ascorbate transporter subunit IIC n=1 Tax=Anaerobacillus arseniciselenatis TaxID=85682 RepID=A0A1S2L570_9BACI|nr:PTS ascorbate transporter subunit IIC [Anaerobacillus arseniciselenatis]
MENIASVWDWSFFWQVFGFILGIVASFIMIYVAIQAVGLLLKMVVDAIRTRN